MYKFVAQPIIITNKLKKKDSGVKAKFKDGSILSCNELFSDHIKVICEYSKTISNKPIIPKRTATNKKRAFTKAYLIGVNQKNATGNKIWNPKKYLKINVYSSSTIVIKINTITIAKLLNFFSKFFVKT